MLKKIIASAVIAAFTAAVVIVSANAGTAGKAWVCAADDTWDVQYWGDGHKSNSGIASAVDAEITGDGVYTASVEFEQAINYGQFFALGTDFKAMGSRKGEAAFADYPEAKLSVISVKADGVEIQGDKSVCNMNYYDTMAVYIYNPWEDGKYNYTENLDWTEGISSLEITFRVTGMDAAAEESVTPGEISSVVAVETQVTETSAGTEKTTETSVQDTETEAVTEKPAETNVETTDETTVVAVEKPAESTAETSAAETGAVASETAVSETETVSETVTAVTEEKPAVEETTADTEDTAVNTDNTEKTPSGDADTNKPSADSVTDSVNTGNASVNGIAALMMCAGVTAVLSKKQK